MHLTLERMKKVGTELAQSLFPEYRYELIDDLLVLGKSGWNGWFFRNLGPCLDYLAATPTIRKRAHREGDTRNHLRLTLGALVLHRSAIVLQFLEEQHEMDNYPQSKAWYVSGYQGIHRKFAFRSLGLLYHLKSFSTYPLDMINELVAISEGAYFEEHPDFPYEYYTDILIYKENIVDLRDVLQVFR